MARQRRPVGRPGRQFRQGGLADEPPFGLQAAVEKGVAQDLEIGSAEARCRQLQELAAGTSDAAIIDLLMADAMIGEGTGFAGLTYTAQLNSEEYGVGFRKDSDLTAAFNEFYAAAIADGTVDAIAEQYGISADALIK